MKEETWIAINSWRACKASMTVKVYDRQNPCTDEVETVREIASIQGVADSGSAYIWTKGTPGLEQMRWFLPLGLQWVLKSTTDGNPDLGPLPLQAPQPLPVLSI